MATDTTTPAATTPWDEMGKRWREMLDQQAELARGLVSGQAKVAGAPAAGPAGGVGAQAAAVAELWSSWLTLGGSLGSAVVPTVGEPGKVAGATLGRFLDPMSLALAGGNQIGDAIRGLTEGPRFADIGAMERRMARVLELWLAAQGAARAHEATVAGTWLEANNRFLAAFGEGFGSGGKPSSRPKEALKLWLDTANQTLLEAQRSPRFLETQGEVLRRGMEFLLAAREMFETFIEPTGLPTRPEIDEVHRTVQELKRRVRALEKAAQREPATVTAAVAPAPSPSPPAVARPRAATAATARRTVRRRSRDDKGGAPA